MASVQNGGRNELERQTPWIELEWNPESEQTPDKSVRKSGQFSEFCELACPRLERVRVPVRGQTK